MSCAIPDTKTPEQERDHCQDGATDPVDEWPDVESHPEGNVPAEIQADTSAEEQCVGERRATARRCRYRHAPALLQSSLFFR